MLLIHTYVEQQIHEDLRIQHLEWVEPDTNLPRVIRTRRAWWNCSIAWREENQLNLLLILIAPSKRNKT